MHIIFFFFWEWLLKAVELLSSWSPLQLCSIYIPLPFLFYEEFFSGFIRKQGGRCQDLSPIKDLIQKPWKLVIILSTSSAD